MGVRDLRVYPTLTGKDIQRVLDETPPPDRVRPGLVVPIEVAPGRRRKDPGPLLGSQGREPETGEPAGDAVVSLEQRRRLKRRHFRYATPGL